MNWYVSLAGRIKGEVGDAEPRGGSNRGGAIAGKLRVSDEAKPCCGPGISNSGTEPRITRVREHSGESRRQSCWV